MHAKYTSSMMNFYISILKFILIYFSEMLKKKPHYKNENLGKKPKTN